MANQITDNRTLVVNADSVTNWVASSSAALDTEIFITGTGSIAESMTNSLRYVMFNTGATQNWANNVFYLWVNCGIVGLLDTVANGGFRIRFAGPTVTNFFDAYVGGNNSWPPAVAGGWVQFVVDIETARSTAVTNGWTGGTPPATSAIQHIGYAAITTIMTRTTDNTWIDSIWRLPDGTPGIIVEGRNGGTTPWKFSDIFTQLGQAAGSFRPSDGGAWVCNTPIQLGINDSTIHAFSDTNQVVLWDNQTYIPTDLYKFSAIAGGAGSNTVTLGVKTGTGDDATGAQGVVFSAASTGVRYDLDFDDANLTSVGLYGCTFQHAGTFQLDDAAVEVISCLYIDCTLAVVSNSLQLRNSIIDPNTADGVAFMQTDDLTDIRICSFQWSDGHAVELTTPRTATQTSKGNLFSGFGATGTNDAAIYNNTAGAVTINVTTAGDTPTYRNGTSASTTVNNNINVTLTGLKDNTEIRIYAEGTTTPELAGIENATDGTAGNRSFAFALTAGTVIDIRIFAIGYNPADILSYTVPNADTSVPIQQVADRWYTNP